MPSELPCPAPNPDSQPYWDAARTGRLLLKGCPSCKRPHFPPRYLCPWCWTPATEWIESAGLGSVYSYTVMRRAPLKEFAALVPYVVALIDLDEGPRMLANVVGANALEVRIGSRVRVTYEKRGESVTIPQFMMAA
jgi:uncharacterized OB-fold protein